MNQDFLAADLAAIMPMVIEEGLLTSLCTISVPPTDEDSFDAGGALKPDATWPVLEGHEDIRCKAAPLSTGDSVRATRRKEMDKDESKAERHVLLEAYYPQLLPVMVDGQPVMPTLRATIDGVQFDVMNAEADSHGNMTRLEVELVKI